VDEHFENAKKLVEGVIERLGLDPATARAKDVPEQASWTVKRGSANILITVLFRVEDQTTYFRVVSPVMTLPAENLKRQPLFKRLLELNATGLVNSAFGLVGDRVVVVSERPAAGLDGDEVSQIVKHLSAVADTYDDRLVKEFGGKIG
jgi:type III secretion system-like peptide-binding chaperone